MTTTTDLCAVALSWHDAGRAVAVATVVETWGSAPRGVGSQLVIDASGVMQGSVSGGCVEGAVIVEAMDAIADGQMRLLEYGVSDDDAFAVGLACGGRIRVLVEPVGAVMPVHMLRDLVAAKAERRRVGYEVHLESGQRRLVDTGAYPDAFRLDRSGVQADGQTFVAVHNPPLRMIIVGAVHIAQELVPMVRACGFAPVVVDPRSAFASAERFPDTQLVVDWPDAALAQIGLDGRTAVVTLSHDPKLDDPAIMAALGANVFYLGCLGSTRTHAKRVARLSGAGFTATQIASIHAPVGLDLGGRQPAEIAVSITAQVIGVLRRT